MFIYISVLYVCIFYSILVCVFCLFVFLDNLPIRSSGPKSYIFHSIVRSFLLGEKIIPKSLAGQWLFTLIQHTDDVTKTWLTTSYIECQCRLWKCILFYMCGSHLALLNRQGNNTDKKKKILFCTGQDNSAYLQHVNSFVCVRACVCHCTHGTDKWSSDRLENTLTIVQDFFC